MEQVIESSLVDVFNTPLEAGLRSLILLNSYHPNFIDFETIVKLDYVIVYSKDFGGASNLHPSVPNRKGELIIRRDLVRDGLNMMKRLGLIDGLYDEKGIRYSVTGDAEPLLRLMKSKYTQKLKTNAVWCVDQLEHNGCEYFNNLIMDLEL